MVILINYIQRDLLGLPVTLRLKLCGYTKLFTAQQFMLGRELLTIDQQITGFNPLLQPRAGEFRELFGCYLIQPAPAVRCGDTGGQFDLVNIVSQTLDS